MSTSTASTSPTASQARWQGLWSNNPALVQLLGLCPLLGVSSNMVNALGLGLATLMVLMGSNLLVSLFRKAIADTIRLPVFVMIIAALTTCVELVMQAWAYDLYRVLGIFLPLIVTNCIILGRAESFASRNSPGAALLDGLVMGLGFLAVLLVLGALREMIGEGTLMADMDLLLGPVAREWTITLVAGWRPFLFVVLPPGAFVCMGLLIAAKNAADSRRRRKSRSDVASTQRNRGAVEQQGPAAAGASPTPGGQAAAPLPLNGRPRL